MKFWLKSIYFWSSLVIFFNLFNSAYPQEKPESKAVNVQEKSLPPKNINLFFLTANYFPADHFSYQGTEFFSKIKLFQVNDINFFSILKLENICVKDELNQGYFPEKLYHTLFSIRAQNNNFYVDIALFSKSDQPFYSKNETHASIAGFYNIIPTAQDSPNGLYAGFFYLPFDTILGWDYPIPLISYQYFSRQTTLMIGLPCVIRYNVLPFVILHLFYIPTLKIKASIDIYLSRKSKITLEGSWWEDSYDLTQRPNPEEMLYFETIKTGLRFSHHLFTPLELSFYLGRTLEAKYFKGTNYSNSYEERKINNTWFFELALKSFF